MLEGGYKDRECRFLPPPCEDTANQVIGEDPEYDIEGWLCRLDYEIAGMFRIVFETRQMCYKSPALGERISGELWC